MRGLLLSYCLIEEKCITRKQSLIVCLDLSLWSTFSNIFTSKTMKWCRSNFFLLQLDPRLVLLTPNKTWKYSYGRLLTIISHRSFFTKSFSSFSKKNTNNCFWSYKFYRLAFCASIFYFLHLITLWKAHSVIALWKAHSVIFLHRNEVSIMQWRTLKKMEV